METIKSSFASMSMAKYTVLDLCRLRDCVRSVLVERNFVNSEGEKTSVSEGPLSPFRTDGAPVQQWMV